MTSRRLHALGNHRDALGRCRAAAFALGASAAKAQSPADAVAIDADDIGGLVSSARGPEAGVWVIAETTSLPTKFAKIVVTDDRGRYLVPDLPKASYSVWVRGYGLVDSQKVQSAPGRTLNLTATVAPDARAAAQYYPAGYWASIIQRARQDRVSRARAPRATASRRR